MKLACVINPEYFDQLGDQKIVEYRQVEEIKFTNAVTGDIRIFNVSDIQRIHPKYFKEFKTEYPDVPWDPRYPIFGILLGNEIKSDGMPQTNSLTRNEPDTQQVVCELAAVNCCSDSDHACHHSSPHEKIRSRDRGCDSECVKYSISCRCESVRGSH